MPRGIAGDQPDPPDLLRPGRPTRAARHVALGGVAAGIANGARWLLGGAAPSVLVGLALLGGGAGRRAARRRRAARAAARARWRAGARRLVGPDERERAVRAAAPRRRRSCSSPSSPLALALRVYQPRRPAGRLLLRRGRQRLQRLLAAAHRTRRDRRALPLYVWSFGVSYKNPVFIYSAMLPMALLGPTELAVRLTAALYGFGTVLAMFFLGRALMGPLVGLIAALLLAVCPWHLHFSRIGFELITLPFFFILALTCLVRWTQGRRTLPQAMVLLGLCLYTYVPAKLFVPLFLAGFAAALLAPRCGRAGARAVLAAGAAARSPSRRWRSSTCATASRRAATSATPRCWRATSRRSRWRARFAENYARVLLARVPLRRQQRPHHPPQRRRARPALPVLRAAARARRRSSRCCAATAPCCCRCCGWRSTRSRAALMNEIPSASRGFIGAPAFCLRRRDRRRRRAAPGDAGRASRRGVVWALQGALVLAAALAVLVPAVRALLAALPRRLPALLGQVVHRLPVRAPAGGRLLPRALRRVRPAAADDAQEQPAGRLPALLRRAAGAAAQRHHAAVRAPREDAGRQRRGATITIGTPGPAACSSPCCPRRCRCSPTPTSSERVIAPDGSAAFVIVAASAPEGLRLDLAGRRAVARGRHVAAARVDARRRPRARSAGVRWRLYDQPFARRRPQRLLQPRTPTTPAPGR